MIQRSTGTYSPVGPNTDELLATYNAKYEDVQSLGWGPRTRFRFGHYSPDEYYETVVAKLVTEGCNWLDVGCGREIFPSNPKLAAVLASRAHTVFGIDPDENIHANPLLTEKHQGPIESYSGSIKFDVATFRMVAEHVEHPDQVVNKVWGLMKPGGQVVIYTPNKWSPMAILTRMTSLNTHHFFKRLLWQTQERDTFPTQFKMNTKRELIGIFESRGFEVDLFQYLDDCRTFNNFRFLNLLELSVWKALNTFRLAYPETCLLGVFRRKTEST